MSIIQSNAPAEIGMSVDVDVLDEMFEREDHECQSKHAWQGDSPAYCTHKVSHRMTVPTCYRGTILICEHAADVFFTKAAEGKKCAKCHLPVIDCWKVLPV